MLARHLIFSLSLFISSVSHTQENFHTIGLVTDEEILLDNVRPFFAKHKAAEVFMTLKENIPPSAKTKYVRDTVFYGLDKDGYVRYSLLQLFDTWLAKENHKHKNDNGWRGYDTTYFESPCSPLFYCEKMEPGAYDSIKEKGDQKEVYLTYNHKQTKVINIFDEKGRLTEQRVRNNWMDGSSTYKAIYNYHATGKLKEIQFFNIAKTRTKRSGDIFLDFEFAMLSSKRFTYTKNGQLLTMTYHSRKTIDEPFHLALTAYYEYKNGLPSNIKYVTEGPGDHVEQELGYKYRRD